MTPYIWAGDDESTGMSSFTWQDNAPAPETPKTYRVVRTWGGVKVNWLTGQSKAAAQAVADNLNELVAAYRQSDSYSVEEE